MSATANLELMRAGIEPLSDAAQSAQLLTQGIEIAQRLYKDGLTQIEAHIMVGETEAVTAYVGGLLTRSSVIYGSIPGASKTEALRNMHRIVDGIEDENVANVPARADIKESELVGKVEAIITTTTDPDGKTTVERLTGEIAQPLITRDTQVVTHDEANRGDERVANAMLDVTGSRRLPGPNGSEEMEDLEVCVLAVNPTESLQTTTPLSPARAARQQWGAILADESAWDTILDAIVDKNFEPTPEEMVPAVTLTELHIAQAALRHVIIDSDILRPYIKEMTKQVLFKLRDSDLQIREAPGRVAIQIMSSARAVALMNGRGAVIRRDIERAAQFKMAATMIGNGVDDLDHVYPLVNEVLNAGEQIHGQLEAESIRTRRLR